MARDSELEAAPVDSNGQSFNGYGYSDNPDTSLNARRQQRAAMVPTITRETQEQNEGKNGGKGCVKKNTQTNTRRKHPTVGASITYTDARLEFQTRRKITTLTNAFTNA